MASHAPSISPSPRPRDVLIVDDSAVARAVMTRALLATRRWNVVEAVATVAAAKRVLGERSVDAILLDLNLPGVDGLTGLPDLKRATPDARIVIVTSAAPAADTHAILLGAADVVRKPGPNEYGGAFAAELVAALERVEVATPSRSLCLPPPRPSPSRGLAPDFDVVAIGASTGGVHALSTLLREVPTAVSTPILITQHLPASFMPFFAAQLALLGRRPCEVAVDRLRLRPGQIVLAPGDAHMVAVPLPDGGTAIRLSTAPAASGCLPSVDPMLTSLAAIHGDRLLVAILSGMGRDGAEGARIAHAAGACVLAQDSASCVIWGMPGAAVAAGAVTAELPPDAIGRVIGTGRKPA